MKVILLEELKGKGREGDVVDVARGFAVNYLLPRKLAVEATRGNLKQLESRRTNIETREAVRRVEAEGLAASLQDKRVTISAKAGEEGKLYGSVTSAMIAEAVSEQLGIEVDKRRLDVAEHIKTLGEHEVTLHVHQDVNATMKVNVTPEGGAVEAPVETPVPAQEAVEAGVPDEPVAEEPAEETEEETRESVDTVDNPE